jgi:predicted extracellular nuclease
MPASFTDTYSQTFDGLANSGGNNIWANDVTLPGWFLFRQPSTSPVAITAYGAGNGSANGGSFYSYGSTGSSDRAIGGLGSNGNYFGSPSSNNLAGWIALTLTNDSGSTINALDLSFNGEQWRNGGNASAQSMVLEYGFGSTFAAVSNWMAPGGNFNWTSPVASSTSAAVDGNGAGRVSNRGGSLQNLGWLASSTLWFRWIENNDTGNDHGLAIDDVSITLGASLPVVTISSLDAAAAEQGDDVASLRISRSGSSAAALTVNISLAGSASLSSDYSLSTSTAGASINGSTALIPAGQSWLDVIITPINDNLIEGSEIVQLSLASSSNYASGSPVSATVSIGDDDEGAGSIQITEYMYNGAGTGGLGEFIEFTNLSSIAVNMAGWSFDDNSRAPGSQDLSSFDIINPGESVILTESTAVAFRSAWSLSESVKVIGGSTNNLARADEINLYNAAGALVDRLSYDDQTIAGTIRTQLASGWAPPSKLTSFQISSDWQLASLNDAQNSRSSSAGEIGNPGSYNSGVAGLLLIQSGGSSSVAEGGAGDTISLALRSQPSADVVVNLNGGSQLTASSPSLLFTSSNWSVAQGISLSAINDVVGEGSHAGSLSFQLSSADSNYHNLSIAPLAVTISDNDLVTAAPTIREATAAGWINLPASGPGGFVGGVVGDPTDPAQILGIDFTIADFDTPLGDLQISANSSNGAVVPTANLVLSGSGSSRKLSVNPTGVGLSTITLTVGDGLNSADYQFTYAASAASALPSSSRFHSGASDASSAIALDDSWMLVADDEDQVLRLFNRSQSGLAVAGFDFSSSLGLEGNSEVDLEASTRLGNTLYWLGSHGNNTSGADRSNRERLFATSLSGSGSSISLSFLGDYRYLEDDLIAWDAANGNRLGLAASAAAGVLPDQVAGFNIEGLCIAPDHSSAYLAFRAPTTPTTSRDRALIIPVLNFTSLISSGGGTPGSAQFGSPISLDLGGRGIRSIDRNGSGEYLIIAGPSGAATGSAPVDFRLYSWTGYASDAPLLRQTDLTALQNSGSFEAIVAVPDALSASTRLQVLSDNGDSIWYGNGVISKDLEIENGFDKNLQKFRSDWLSLGAAYVPVGSLALSSAYSQDFDSLISSGSSNWSDNQIAGWYAARSGSGSSLVASSGTNTSGNLYSFGSDGATDRALGSVGSGNDAAGSFWWGARFYNDTGRQLDTLHLSYRGEQWRNSGASAQALDLQWRLGGSSLSDGTWTNAPQLGFSAAQSGGSAGSLNGNLAANSRLISGSLTGLGLAAGQELWLRWSDPDHSGSDHGLAIDAVRVSTSPLPAVRILASGSDTSVAETSPNSGSPVSGPPASDTVSVGLATSPSSAVTVTLTADSQVELSADGIQFGSSLSLVLSDTNPRSVTIRAVDDALLEAAIHSGVVRTQVSSSDAAYNGLQVEDLTVLVSDNDQSATLTPIHAIQGQGSSSPLLNQRHTVEGVVVASFPGSTGLNGFYLQEEDGDADSDPTSSEGIFVFDPSGLFSGAVGTRLRLSGLVAELATSGSGITGSTLTSSLTQLTAIADLSERGPSPLPTAVSVSLPQVDATELERYEGMRVRLSAANGDLVVTDTFGLGRYGEVGLSAGGRLTTFSQNNAPSVAGYSAYLADLLDNYITLDDGNSSQNPATVIHARGGNPLSASNTLRGGDSITAIEGVLDQRFDGYRVQSSTGANFTASNPRTASAPAPSGNLRVASFNLLNFFNGNGGGGGFPTSRGAESLLEFQRQLPKTTAAILGLGADIVGYLEMENDGFGAGSAVGQLVEALNGQAGASLWSFVQPDSGSLNGSGGFGGDEITVGYLYRNDRVRLAPGSRVARQQSGSYSQGTERVQRPVLAATFERLAAGTPTAEFLTTAIAHLKSKGSSAGGAGDADAGDGQGLSNGSRSRGAAEMANWLATNPTGNGDTDILILGDLNAYLQEDPITILASRGYQSLYGPSSYSFQFNGQWGSLDHALASNTLAAQVSGSYKWHINADEPVVLDYNTNFKSSSQISSFYAGDPYRSSDHDPLLVDLTLLSSNRAPTAVNLMNSTSLLAENTPTTNPIRVADVVISDDAYGSNQLSLGGADAAAFELIGQSLYLRRGVVLDRESRAGFSVSVLATDPSLPGSTPVATTLQLNLADVNEYGVSGPVDSDPAANEVAENVAIGTLVGLRASASDGDATSNQIHYALVADASGSNAYAGGLFSIDDVTGVVRVAGGINYETAASHSIHVLAGSADGSQAVTQFNIRIADVNEAPTALTLSSTRLNENIAADSIVANLSSSDPDSNQTHTFSLLPGVSDNLAFSIRNNDLRISRSPDFETKPYYDLQLRVSDQGGLSFDRAVRLWVNDLADSPTYSCSQSSNMVYEGSSVIYSLSTTNLAAGTPIYWQLYGSSISNSDLSDGQLSGAGLLGSDGKYSFMRSFSSDSLLEGDETIQLGFFADAARSVSLGAALSLVIKEPSVGMATDGNDMIIGSSAHEDLCGIAAGSTLRGRGSIDKLSGNGGNDLFWLGDRNGRYYNDGIATSNGAADFAWITDFGSGDRIQLNGSASNYSLKSGTYSGNRGLFISVNTPLAGSSPETIGFVQGAVLSGSGTLLGLYNPSQFLYV